MEVICHKLREHIRTQRRNPRCLRERRYDSAKVLATNMMEEAGMLVLAGRVMEGTPARALTEPVTRGRRCEEDLLGKSIRG